MAHRAQLLLDRILHKVDENLPPDWPGDIPAKMQPVAKKLYRLQYFEPEQRFAAAMLQVIERGDALTEKQLTALKRDRRCKRGSTCDRRARMITCLFP